MADRSRAEAHLPVRTCIGCRGQAATSELLRLVLGTDPDGRPVVVCDPKRVAHGRGAHLHPDLACYELASRRKAFSRALRTTQGGVDTTGVHDYLVARSDR